MPKKPLTKRPTRSIRAIAAEIQAEINSGAWSKTAAAYALPYLRAMHELTNITDRYMVDSGKSVVLYFLCNSQTWRGETARRIKSELRSMVV